MRFTVPTPPIPQGGMTAFIVAGRARVAHKNPKGLQAFRADCRAAAAAAGADILEGAVYLEAEFVLERPKAHWRTGARAGQLKPASPRFSTGRPDGDKLERALWDALSGVCFRDDGQVAEWHGIKRYVRVGEAPHVSVIVEALAETEEA